jgi:predicted phosphate transport protein (TIGR00153 family)
MTGKKGGAYRMGVKEWIIPQEKHFFDMFDQQADVVFEGAEALLDMVTNFTLVAEKRDRIKEIEHKGDELVHHISDELTKTFVTPIDHDDISKLTSRLDDILDFIEAASHRLWSYEIKTIPPEMVKLTEVILASSKEVNHAVKDLRNFKKKNEILTHFIEINRLENVGDDITHVAVAALFKKYDAVDIIKLKEIYEYLEEATDKCEDAADVIKDIFMKNS